MGISGRDEFMNSQTAQQANNFMKKALENMGWEEEESGFEGDGTFSFVGDFIYEDYGWSLKITYNIDETRLACVCVEMEHGTYIDSLKKGFPNYNEDMDGGAMLDGALQAVEMGMKLFQMEDDIEVSEVELD